MNFLSNNILLISDTPEISQHLKHYLITQNYTKVHAITASSLNEETLKKCNLSYS